MSTTTIHSASAALRAPGDEFEFDEAQLAAVSFLARYSGQTLDAYRHDLCGFFQWATDNGIAVLRASRAHIELFRAWMDDRGLAASTIDRRLSTVCGFYRFAHIDGRIRANPAQYVRRPQVHAPDARGLDRSELGVFLFTAERYDRAHAALAVLLGLNGLRVSGLWHQYRGPRPRARPSHTADPGQGRQTCHRAAGSPNRADDRPGGR